MGKLEDFLAGKPLNERIRQLMEEGVDAEDEQPAEAAPVKRFYFDGTPVTNAERDHLRRLLGSAGWVVLLKLLDTELHRQEDSARKDSLNSPFTRKDEIAAAWATLAADMAARNRIVALVEGEVAKLEAALRDKRTKKKCATGQKPTPTGTL